MQPIEYRRVDMICQKHKTSASDCHFDYNEANRTEKKEISKSNNLIMEFGPSYDILYMISLMEHQYNGKRL